MAKGAKVIDNPDIREVYSNRVISSSYDGAAVTIILGQLRGLPERMLENEDVHVAVNNRMVLPQSAVLELHDALGNTIKAMAARPVGSTPVRPPAPSVRPKTN